MYNQFLKPKVEAYLPPINKPAAYIFDVDGTLAKMNGRNAYDWSRVKEDTLNENVVNILHQLKKFGYKIIIFTGRDGICEKETKEWLKQYEIELY